MSKRYLPKNINIMQTLDGENIRKEKNKLVLGYSTVVRRLTYVF